MEWCTPKNCKFLQEWDKERFIHELNHYHIEGLVEDPQTEVAVSIGNTPLAECHFTKASKRQIRKYCRQADNLEQRLLHVIIFHIYQAYSPTFLAYTPRKR